MEEVEVEEEVEIMKFMFAVLKDNNYNITVGRKCAYMNTTVANNDTFRTTKEKTLR